MLEEIDRAGMERSNVWTSVTSKISIWQNLRDRIMGKSNKEVVEVIEQRVEESKEVEDDQENDKVEESKEV